MNRILLKSAAVALLPLGVAALAARMAFPDLGDAVGRYGWMLPVLCALAIAWPAIACILWQGDRLKRRLDELARTHEELVAAHRRLEEKSKHDTMTGMLNRETFFAVLDRSRRKTDRGALLLIDADHFKKINDGFGHLTGDRALLDIAAAISGAVRSGDVLGRIGGEEFAAFLVGANEQEARRVAERMRRAVEAVVFAPEEGRVVPLTVSIGGVVCVADATISDLMRRADQRLYAAKNGGRNLAMFDAGLPEAA